MTKNIIEELLDSNDKESSDKLIDMATNNPHFLLSYIEIQGLDIEKATLRMKMASLFLVRALSINIEKNEI